MSKSLGNVVDPLEIIEGEKTEKKYHPYSGIPRRKSKEQANCYPVST